MYHEARWSEGARDLDIAGGLWVFYMGREERRGEEEGREERTREREREERGRNTPKLKVVN